MSKVDVFIHQFLQAERELHRRFADLEFGAWADFAAPELRLQDPVESQSKWDVHTGLESLDDTGEKVTAVASVIRPGHWETRARFVLCRIDGVWRVEGLGYYCKICNGSGHSFKGALCDTCHGKGYFVAPQFTIGERRDDSGDLAHKMSPSSSQDIDGVMHEFILSQRAITLQIAKMEKELWSRYGLPDLHWNGYEKLHASWDELAKIETFNEAGERASVIATIVRTSRSLTRVRLTMLQVDSGWRICKLEYACTICEGKGVVAMDNGSGMKERVCSLCLGKGWLDPRRPKTK